LPAEFGRSTYGRNHTTYVEKKPGPGVWGLSGLMSDIIY
jgi:hypothetical protein